MYTCDKWSNSETANVIVPPCSTNLIVEQSRAVGGIRTLARPTDSSQNASEPPARSVQEPENWPYESAPETPPRQCLEFHPQRFIPPRSSALLGYPESNVLDSPLGGGGQRQTTFSFAGADLGQGGTEGREGCAEDSRKGFWRREP